MVVPTANDADAGTEFGDEGTSVIGLGDSVTVREYACGGCNGLAVKDVGAAKRII